jgi:hypothetical protein
MLKKQIQAEFIIERQLHLQQIDSFRRFVFGR